MNQEAGFHASGAPYEVTVAEKTTRTLIFKKISLIALYVLWGVGIFLIGMNSKLFLPLMAFIPLSVWVLVFFTWRLTQVEYEYSLFSGELTVSRTLGGKTRRELCRVTLRSIDRALPAEETYQAEIDAFAAEKTIYAVSNDENATVYTLLWKTEDGKRTALFFEPDEKALKIIKYYNRAALTVSSENK